MRLSAPLSHARPHPQHRASSSRGATVSANGWRWSVKRRHPLAPRRVQTPHSASLPQSGQTRPSSIAEPRRRYRTVARSTGHVQPRASLLSPDDVSVRPSVGPSWVCSAKRRWTRAVQTHAAPATGLHSTLGAGHASLCPVTTASSARPLTRTGHRDWYHQQNQSPRTAPTAGRPQHSTAFHTRFDRFSLSSTSSLPLSSSPPVSASSRLNSTTPLHLPLASSRQSLTRRPHYLRPGLHSQSVRLLHDSAVFSPSKSHHFKRPLKPSRFVQLSFMPCP
ncbi:unnamed protein product [Protopolystoma xenopodis]|uniref:Uncharacterized protein n=1 Tax=Protopolystoma xenopodis TaxID=117903 RepID=A0A448WF94_9PLAT|nr:unnamed protein product [Protopolystoma xenopodis]